MKTYQVTIAEVLQKTVEVQAGSSAEAEASIGGKWKNSEYILDADDFKGVNFHAKLV